MFLDLMIVYLVGFLFAWLIICVVSWLMNGSFHFFNPQAIFTHFKSEPDVKIILAYKKRLLPYTEAKRILRIRNSDLTESDIEMLLLDDGEFSYE